MDEGGTGAAARVLFTSSLNHSVIQVECDLRKSLIQPSLLLLGQVAQFSQPLDVSKVVTLNSDTWSSI